MRKTNLDLWRTLTISFTIACVLHGCGKLLFSAAPTPQTAELIEVNIVEESDKIIAAEAFVDTKTEVKKRAEEKIKATGTYYNPVESQCDSDPLITASGSKIDLEKLEKGDLRWVAVSWDLYKELGGFGKSIRIESKKDPSINGVYVIKDLMNERWKKKIDFLYPESKKSRGYWDDLMIAKV